ncbi:MAG: FUSC family protein [Janthinobacterium lividum]
MKLDAEAALFAIKCYIAAMLAYYVALSIGLTRPFWAVVTSYIIAQPLAGAVRSKAIYRLGGTLLGATAAVVLVPTFVNEPMVLSGALALWLGLCLYVALLDRTPRAYVFLLAGYTASIIGLPSVDAPGGIFTTAILRVQEIGLGILCASLVHGLIFPRTVTAELLARVDTILADAERWSREALAGGSPREVQGDRRRLAVDLGILHQLSTHLPFDTARLVPRSRTVRAMEDRLTLLLPLLSTMEDRLHLLGAEPAGMPDDLRVLIADVEHWLGGPVGAADRGMTAAVLIERTRAMEPALDGPEPCWRDLVRLNLLDRLADLIATHRDARDLTDQLRAPSARPTTPRVGDLLAGAGRRALHRDHRLALETAAGTIMTLVLGCAFWIGTAWVDGAGAALIAGITCALFGALDTPGPVIRTMLAGSTVGLLTAIFYAYAVLPGATDFVTVAAVLAPPLLVMGALMAKPKTAGFGLGLVLGFPQSVGLNATYVGNFAGALNGAIAQTVGITFALVTVGLFQGIGAQGRSARLLRAAGRDVALRAAGREPDGARWTGRMLDRVGLMVPRLAAPGADAGGPLLAMLVDLRVGFVSGELDEVRTRLSDRAGAPLAALLAGVARHFTARRPDRLEPAQPDLLRLIDDGVEAVGREPQGEVRRRALVALTSLRRNLFSDAVAYGAAA